ncbi:MAG TPA: thermonuclease family protein [Thermomicrobiales bacterium]|nr:thermonuclease family protein [Thermomicrobiales bacterium]
MRLRPIYRVSFVCLFMLALVPLTALAKDRNEDRTIPKEAVPATFVDIVDGDTIKVRIDDARKDNRIYTVRLIGIDTPETNYSYGNHPECYGKEASKRTESLLVAAVNDQVWLEKDVSETDKNGRLLRYVWYTSTIDGKVHLLNEQLVREGYALAKTYRPDTARQEELDAAEKEAIRNAAGMWLSCDASVSMDPDKEDANRGPDKTPIDRTKVPAEVEEDAACSLFDTYEQAQEFLAVFPELADMIDTDHDGIACETWFGQ